MFNRRFETHCMVMATSLERDKSFRDCWSFSRDVFLNSTFLPFVKKNEPYYLILKGWFPSVFEDTIQCLAQNGRQEDEDKWVAQLAMPLALSCNFFVCYMQPFWPVSLVALRGAVYWGVPDGTNPFPLVHSGQIKAWSELCHTVNALFNDHPFMVSGWLWLGFSIFTYGPLC